MCSNLADNRDAGRKEVSNFGEFCLTSTVRFTVECTETFFSTRRRLGVTPCYRNHGRTGLKIIYMFTNVIARCACLLPVNSNHSEDVGFGCVHLDHVYMI